MLNIVFTGVQIVQADHIIEELKLKPLPDVHQTARLDNRFSKVIFLTGISHEFVITEIQIEPPFSLSTS